MFGLDCFVLWAYCIFMLAECCCRENCSTLGSTFSDSLWFLSFVLLHPTPFCGCHASLLVYRDHAPCFLPVLSFLRRDKDPLLHHRPLLVCGSIPWFLIRVYSRIALLLFSLFLVFFWSMHVVCLFGAISLFLPLFFCCLLLLSVCPALFFYSQFCAVTFALHPYLCSSCASIQRCLGASASPEWRSGNKAVRIELFSTWERRID